MCSALNLNVLNLGKEDLSLVNNGALAEQFIGQHLMHSGLYYETPTLYYPHCSCSSSLDHWDRLR